MTLQEYSRKRDFAKTAEPTPDGKAQGKSRGAGQGSGAARGAHRFVIQKHAASRPHYDFRLELDGALKSWAVPKGIPFAKGEKHLAVRVEDHPLSYMDFEGTIPKGQYGGGTVMVWDTGTYEPLSDTPREELEGGKLHFVLSGKKLKGEWYLARPRKSDEWLLIRGGESMKPVTKKADDTSALSGKSMAQLSKGERVWQSKPAGENGAKKGARAAKVMPLPLPLPQFLEPMKAKLVAAPPGGEGWLYEIKFDGFRALGLKGGAEVALLSRTENDLGTKFPEVLAAVRALPARECVVDGEIVALDKKGRSSFQLLQAYELGQERPPLCFYLFDLPRLDGKDLRKLPLTERKEMLGRLLEGAPSILRFSGALGGDARALLKKVAEIGLEGLIGKREDSPYEAGLRSGKWIKLKIVSEQEFVIGGYTPPAGSRRHFGALLLGVYAGKELRYVGKVGTGFNDKLLRELHARFEPLAREQCPFANLPAKSSGRWGQGVTVAEMRRCTWLAPRLVCQVKFAEWTRDKRLRQPVFLGLREDKKAREVAREEAAT